MKTILIKGALIVDAKGQFKGELLIEGQKIAQVAPKCKAPSDAHLIDASSLILMPALIDAHTHYHLESRNTVTADSFIEGSRLAAFGGVTTIIDFADHDKNKTLVESANARIEAMKEEMEIDFALHQGVYQFNEKIEKELKELVEKGITTIKVFTTYKDVGYLIEKENLRSLFKAAAKYKIMVSVHCEDDEIIEQTLKEYKGDFSIRDHPKLRPVEAEKEALKYVGSLAKEFDTALYIVHLSSGEGLSITTNFKNENLRVGVETTPHYLYLNQTLLEKEKGQLYLMTPPLRKIKDNEELQKGIKNNLIDVVATDHCSFTKGQKLKETDCRYVLPGIPGTEEMFSLLFTNEIAKGNLSLSQFVDLLSTKPAKLFGLYPQKGSLECGTDADLILIDPNKEFSIETKNMHTKANYSAYEPFKAKGKVVATFLRGQLIADENNYYAKKGGGLFLKAKQSSLYSLGK
jgi:dihydropyrimidinase